MTSPVLAVCVDVVGEPLELVSHTLNSEAVIGGEVFKEGLAVKDSLYALDNSVDLDSAIARLSRVLMRVKPGSGAAEIWQARGIGGRCDVAGRMGSGACLRAGGSSRV